MIGLILAALLSSAMSSVSADLNSVATVATKDHFLRLRPNAADRVQLTVGRLGVVAGGIASTGAALALTMTRATASYEIIAMLVSVLEGGVLGLFALGFFSRRATRLGANIGIFACLTFVTWATVTGALGVDIGYNFEMTPMLIGVISHVLLFGVGFAVSMLFGGKRTAESELTVWSMKQKG